MPPNRFVCNKALFSQYCLFLPRSFRDGQLLNCVLKHLFGLQLFFTKQNIVNHIHNSKSNQRLTMVGLQSWTLKTLLPSWHHTRFSIANFCSLTHLLSFTSSLWQMASNSNWRIPGGHLLATHQTSCWLFGARTMWSNTVHNVPTGVVLV